MVFINITYIVMAFAHCCKVPTVHVILEYNWYCFTDLVLTVPWFSSVTHMVDSFT